MRKNVRERILQTEIQQQPNGEKLTEDGMNEADKSSSELDENIHHTKGIDKKKEETREYFFAVERIIGLTKDFIIDTVSQLSILPPDKTILKSTERN